jgi:hypothetical protein
MAYKIVEPLAGLVQIGVIDTGRTYLNSLGATITTPDSPMYVGMIVKAVDPVLGGGEFILLPGVAGTQLGSVVSYNTVNFTTALCVATALLPVHIAIAMSANNTATGWGWYQISGVAVVLKASGDTTLVAAAAVGAAPTAGYVSASVAGMEWEGAVCCVTPLAGATTVQVMINRTAKQGRIT